jgi:hypothetical protein
MFKNRAIQVKMVKNDKEDAPKPTTSDQFRVNAATMRIASLHIKNTILTIGKVVVVYVAADTIRQVMVEQAKK